MYFAEGLACRASGICGRGRLGCGATVLISLLTHAVTFEGYQADADYLFLVCVLLGYVIQGAAEELLIHGLFMTTLFRDVKWFPSVIYSSLLFVLMHVTNNGFSLLSSLNVFLFSVFLGLYVIRTGSIFGAAAIHSAWNFLEGHVFGCSVSGFASPGSVFVLTADPTRAVTNGGTFGPEGGLAATMVLMLAIIAVSFIPSIGKNRESAT